MTREGIWGGVIRELLPVDRRINLQKMGDVDLFHHINN
jgi:hypothetical protein